MGAEGIGDEPRRGAAQEIEDPERVASRGRVRLLDRQRLLIGGQPGMVPVAGAREGIELPSPTIELEQATVRAGAPVGDHAAAVHRKRTARACRGVGCEAIGDFDW
jgi:hypothetical protein